jgi:hypothetical protein
LFELVAAEKRIYIHTELLRRLPEPLSCLVGSGMRESCTNRVDFSEDWTLQTILCMVTFAYRNDYWIPEPPMLSKPEQLKPRCETSIRAYVESRSVFRNQFDSIFDNERSFEDGYRKQKWRDCLNDVDGERFAKAVCHFLSNSRCFRSDTNKFEFDGSSSLSEVLVQHAEIYLFGEVYALNDLMAVSEGNIFNILFCFPLIASRFPDLVPLIDFVVEKRTTRGQPLASASFTSLTPRRRNL